LRIPGGSVEDVGSSPCVGDWTTKKVGTVEFRGQEKFRRCGACEFNSEKLDQASLVSLPCPVRFVKGRGPLVFSRGVFVNTIPFEEAIVQILCVIAVGVNIRHDVLGLLAQGGPLRSVNFQGFEREDCRGVGGVVGKFSRMVVVVGEVVVVFLLFLLFLFVSLFLLSLVVWLLSL
jgi:hypothetical protein